jgi:hypothetical protein
MNILSEFLIVDNLCAITIDVLHFISLSSAFCTNFSVLLSSAEVASSNIKILGFFKNNLAIASLCFSHQLNFNHLSQIIVLIHLSSLNTKLASAFFSASSISSSLASLFANNKFSLMVVLKRLLS